MVARSSGKVRNKGLFEFHKLRRFHFEEMLDGDVFEDPLVELVDLVVLDVHEREADAAGRFGGYSGAAVRRATRREIGHVVAVVVGQAQDRLVLAVLSASWVDGPCDAVRESDTENNVTRFAIVSASKEEARRHLGIGDIGSEFLDFERVVWLHDVSQAAPLPRFIESTYP